MEYGDLFLRVGVGRRFIKYAAVEQASNISEAYGHGIEEIGRFPQCVDVDAPSNHYVLVCVVEL